MPLFTFKKKGKDAKPKGGSPKEAPLEKVLALRGQGMPNDQIITQLQGEGYSSAQIFDAMNQADMSAAPGSQMAQEREPAQAQEIGGMPPQGMPEMNSGMMEAQEPGMDKEHVEEMVEAIIDERWQELMKNINKIIDWKTKTETRISMMEQNMKNLKADFDKLQSAIVAKVGEYDQNILNVGTEIKAMEKVFQKVLPAFTENVSELSRITQGIKKTGQKPAAKPQPKK